MTDQAERCMHAMLRAYCVSCQPRQTLERGEREHRERQTVTMDDLWRFIDEDLDSGCWLWTGKYKRRGAESFADGDAAERPFLSRVHEMCGHNHFEVARLVFEETIGVVLDMHLDVVYSTCSTNQGDRRPCVNPDHHDVRTAATQAA